jgi:hypothetical protein
VTGWSRRPPIEVCSIVSRASTAPAPSMTTTASIRLCGSTPITTRETPLLFVAINALLTSNRIDRRGGQRYFERGNPHSNHSAHGAAVTASH